jgi:glyoxylase-like metal-dependent hydrolase (beta-lactamase superfamily II)
MSELDVALELKAAVAGGKKYRVTAIQLGNLTVDSSGLLYGAPTGTIVDIPVWGSLIEGAGLKMLVDTGIKNPAWVSERLGPCWQTADQTMVGALDVFGWRPRDIDTVVNTHLHYDHSGNNHYFSHARLFVSKREWMGTAHPHPSQEVLYEEKAWLDEPLTEEAYTFIEHDNYQLASGIAVIQTPGHSIGHQSLLVNTDEGVLCVVGDAVNIEQNFLLRKPGGVYVSVPDATASLEKIRASADRVLMSHDARLLNLQNGDFPIVPPSETAAFECC